MFGSSYVSSGRRALTEGRAREDALGYLADMAIRVGDDADTLVDFTVGGVCCQAYWSHQGVRGGIADHF